MREGLKRLQDEQNWQQVHSFGEPKAKARGFTEDDVMRLIREHREEKKAKQSRNRK